MAYLGVNYVIAYEAKLYQTGFTNIIAMIRLPDGSARGPYAMPAMTTLGFQGVYSFDYISTIEDPEGEYFAAVFSPTENIRDILRFTLDKRPVYAGLTIQPLVENITVSVVDNQTELCPNLNESEVNVELTQPIIDVNNNSINIDVESCDSNSD